MQKKRILFVSQEITPYLPENHMSKIGRHLPQGIQESGKEIRTFMPRFGNINERRNQLHEVIRLSGMNLIINDNDHPLIIKVASIQQARMQVYFIDNEDFFHRKATIRDKHGKFFKDNDERAIFFARGVIETVKKLGWGPDIIHCHGWMSALVPMYIKTTYKDVPVFQDSKVITSLYADKFEESLDEKFADKMVMEGVQEHNLTHFKGHNYLSLMKGAIDHSDGVIFNQEGIDAELESFSRSHKKVLDYPGTDEYIEAFNNFYDSLLES